MGEVSFRSGSGEIREWGIGILEATLVTEDSSPYWILDVSAMSFCP
jgi:hypothetical protein